MISTGCTLCVGFMIRLSLTLHVFNVCHFTFFSIPDNEQLARSGTNCLENFAVSVGRQFFPDTWDKVCYCARDIFLASVPHQLLTWKPDENMLGR